jgi:hypothetical protein
MRIRNTLVIGNAIHFASQVSYGIYCQYDATFSIQDDIKCTTSNRYNFLFVPPFMRLFPSYIFSILEM